MQDKFINFLKEQGVKDKYKERLYLFRQVHIYKYIERKINYPKDFFDCAFIWQDSKDGHKFWSKINSKWLAILRNEKGRK